MHPKLQGPKYRLFRALMFVATGLSGIAPLVHGLNVFGMSKMMRKAFPYTMAKAGCLLSGTAFYAVSLPNSHIREKLILTHGSKGQVSWKPISGQIRLMGLPFDFSHPGGMRRCSPVDGVSGCLRLCADNPYLLVYLKSVLLVWVSSSIVKVEYPKRIHV